MKNLTIETIRTYNQTKDTVYKEYIYHYIEESISALENDEKRISKKKGEENFDFKETIKMKERSFEIQKKISLYEELDEFEIQFIMNDLTKYIDKKNNVFKRYIYLIMVAAVFIGILKWIA